MQAAGRKSGYRHAPPLKATTAKSGHKLSKKFLERWIEAAEVTQRQLQDKVASLQVKKV